MAALPQRDLAIVELRRVSTDQLDPILQQEIASWRSQLDWDFQASADLVRRFVHMQALGGFALMRGGRPIGYSYYVCEEGKGLIGDLYVLSEHRTIENENVLLEAALNALFQTPGLRRVEAQLMMVSSPLDRAVPLESWFRRYPRYFLEAPLAPAARLPEKPLPGVALFPWSEIRQDETARLIATAYQGHVDSQINDQYRSAAGARRFLMNIVQYPGCGTFFGPASFAAFGAAVDGQELRGISLASMIAPDAGHITQVCVAPGARGAGLGYELVRQSLMALALHGCRLASLTVTASNAAAIQLYRRMGFVNRRDFAAYVWEPR